MWLEERVTFNTFLFECNCLIMLCSCCTMKLISHMYRYITSLVSPSPNTLPNLIPLGHQRAPRWAPCATQQVPTSYLFNKCMLSLFSCVQLFATLWTVAHQTPLFMRFSRQEYWSGLPFPTPGNPDPENQTHISYVFCIGRQVLYHQCHLGSPFYT